MVALASIKQIIKFLVVYRDRCDQRDLSRRFKLRLFILTLTRALVFKTFIMVQAFIL